MKKTKIPIILLLILIISIFFRTWQLDSLPPGLYPDEAMNGNDAVESLENKDFKIFYPYNNGREGLFIWIVSASFHFFGISITTLKLPSVIAGILTVLGLYFLTKEIFFENKDKEVIALLSSFFLSVSFWHVNFSRIAFRAILVPFFLVFSFYLILKSFRTKKVQSIFLAGILFGLGFYTYSSFYFATILLFIIYFFNWKKFKKEKKENIFYKLVIINLLTIFLVALPIGIFLLKNPDKMLKRSSQVSIFNTDQPILNFFQSLGLHLIMFNFMGDRNWRHNIAGSPQLLWIVGIFFLFGIFLLIRKIYQKQLKKKDKILLSWFFIMLLPGALTAIGCSHALRVIGTIPAIYIISSWGAVQLYSFLTKKYGLKIIQLISIIVIAAIPMFQFNNYFQKWASNPKVKDAFSSYYVDIGDYLNSVPDSINKIVVINFSNTPKPWPKGLPVSAQTTMFIENTQNKKSTYLLPEEINQIKDEKETIVIPIKKEDDFFFKELEQKFPKGEFIIKNNILIFKI